MAPLVFWILVSDDLSYVLRQVLDRPRNLHSEEVFATPCSYTSLTMQSLQQTLIIGRMRCNRDTILLSDFAKYAREMLFAL